MTNFKVGDRVRKFTAAGNYDGVVIEIDKEGFLVIKTNTDFGVVAAHPKQVRKIRPKQKREWWVDKKHNPQLWENLFECDGPAIRKNKPPHPDGWICLVEKKVKK